MTKQEVKDEMKQSEGDPQIKGKIRQKQRQMAMAGMMQEVPKADVIVTNPTHFAVALKYDAAAGYEAPRVTAKGEDEAAFSMRRIAEENGVPVVENRPVARGLYANTDVGDIIPEEYFRIIADIYAHVMNLHKRL